MLRILHPGLDQHVLGPQSILVFHQPNMLAGVASPGFIAEIRPGPVVDDADRSNEMLILQALRVSKAIHGKALFIRPEKWNVQMHERKRAAHLTLEAGS